MAQPELTACNDFTLLLRGACLALRYLVLPYLTFPCHVLSCPAFPLIPLPLPTSFYLPFFSLPAFPLIPLPLPTSFYLPFLSLPAFPLRTSPYLFLPAFPLVTCLPSHYLTSPYLSLPLITSQLLPVFFALPHKDDLTLPGPANAEPRVPRVYVIIIFR